MVPALSAELGMEQGDRTYVVLSVLSQKREQTREGAFEDSMEQFRRLYARPPGTSQSKNTVPAKG